MRAVQRALERRALTTANALACVSNNLATYMHNVVGARHIEVIPCCVDTEHLHFDPDARASMRQRLGVAPGHVLVSYVGGWSHWQRGKDIAHVMSRLARRSERFRFLLLSPQQANARADFEEYPELHGRVTFDTVEHSKMSQYLSACDVGMLLRHDVLMNAVASPVKVGEYLSCGLFVLLTSGVGDYSSTLPDAGLGMLLEQDLSNTEQVGRYLLEMDFDSVKERASRYVALHLSWQAFRSSFEKLYGNRPAGG